MDAYVVKKKFHHTRFVHWELRSIIRLLHDSIYHFFTCFSSVVSIGGKYEPFTFLWVDLGSVLSQTGQIQKRIPNGKFKRFASCP